MKRPSATFIHLTNDNVDQGHSSFCVYSLIELDFFHQQTNASISKGFVSHSSCKIRKLLSKCGCVRVVMCATTAAIWSQSTGVYWSWWRDLFIDQHNQVYTLILFQSFIYCYPLHTGMVGIKHVPKMIGMNKQISHSSFDGRHSHWQQSKSGVNDERVSKSDPSAFGYCHNNYRQELHHRWISLI